MSAGVSEMGSGPRLGRVAALSIAIVGALSLAAYAQSASSSSSGTSASGSVLPRNVVVPQSAVKRFFPEVTQEASTGANSTAVGKPRATRSVIYTTDDGAKKVTITVDQYETSNDALSAYQQAVQGSKIPGFQPLSAPKLGQQAFAGTVTQGAETHIGLGALDGKLIVGVTLAGYDATPDNTKKLVALAWKEDSAAKAAVAQSGTHAGAPDHVKKASAQEIWAELTAGNKRFMDGKWHPRNHVERRRELVSGQQPRVAVLSCSDSRVPPEILFDQGLGDLFVVRSAGNSADAIGIGSLEYAVEHLGSTVIVVLGHQSCGAVKAACSGEKPPSPGLEAVVQPIGPSCAAAGKQAEKLELAVRDHVHRTAEGLLEKSEILKHAAEKGSLTIVEAYYELETGRVVRLH